MSSQIDFRTLPANVPVLCIPRVYPNISESRIRKIFEELDMGTLERIDVVTKTSDKGEKFNRVFVHFKRWNSSSNANIARERLLNGKDIKIVYDDPWFWKISAYREPERKPKYTEPQNSRRPMITFDSDEERPSKPASSFQTRPRHETRDETRPREERPRPRHETRDETRPREERPRPRHETRDERPRPRDERHYKPITPSNSPPRQRREEVIQREEIIHVEEENGGLTVDYGNVELPPPPRFAKKQPLKIEDEGTA